MGEEGDPAAVGRGAEQPEVGLDELVYEPQPAIAELSRNKMHVDDHALATAMGSRFALVALHATHPHTPQEAAQRTYSHA
jgi:hypothetical protein